MILENETAWLISSTVNVRKCCMSDRFLMFIGTCSLSSSDINLVDQGMNSSIFTTEANSRISDNWND